jgi:hypothetical protein
LYLLEELDDSSSQIIALKIQYKDKMEVDGFQKIQLKEMEASITLNKENCLSY